jgi:anti-sigma-K factor RskA
VDDESSIDHAEVATLLPDYALGALDGELARLVAVHLNRCLVCRREFENALETLALLAVAPPPRPDLRDRLLARAMADPVAPAAADLPAPPTPRSAPSPPPIPLATPAAPRRVVPWPALRPPRWAAALAAVALITLLAIWNLLLHRQLAEREELAALLADPAAVHLLAGEVGEGALIVRPEGDVAVLVAHDLPPLPADSRYQFWLLADGAPPVSGGLFTVDAAGSGHLVVHAPRSLAAYAAAGVTVEPWAGSPAPTSPVLLAGPLG